MFTDPNLLIRIKKNDPTLTDLNLRYQNLTSSDIDELVAALNKNSHIISLNLTGNSIGDAGAISLSHNTSLKSLILQGARISKIGAQALAQHPRLVTLDLSQNHVENAGAISLSQNTNLTTLKLAGNQIDPLGVYAFADNIHLKWLDMSENQLNNAGTLALAQIKSLTTLVLGSNQIGDAGAMALALHPTLTTLVLHHNNITEVGAKALAENTTLTSLNLNYNKLGIEGASIIAQSPSITTLFLAGNDINNVGITELSSNTKLKVLDIAYNQIFDEGVSAFKVNKTLCKLYLDHNQLTQKSAEYLAYHPALDVLSLSYNMLGDEGARTLASHGTSTELDLTGNNITSLGAEALSRNKHLKKLVMSYNSIDDSGAKALGYATNLVELYLSYNLITERGAIALANNKSLGVLSLNYNDIAEAGRKALMQNQSLKLHLLTPERLPDFTNENLRTIFLLTQDLLCIRGLNDIIQFFNPTFSRVLGYKDDELLGHRLRGFLHPDDRAREGKESSDELLKFPISQRAYRYRHKDGSYRVIQWSSQMKRERIYASGLDITEQQQAINKLARAELKNELVTLQTSEASIYSQQLSTFIAHLCHEVRNPLSGIVGSIEGIQDAIKVLLPWFNRVRALSLAPTMEEVDTALAKIIVGNMEEIQNSVITLRKWINHTRSLLSPSMLEEASDALAKIEECATDSQLCTDHEETILNENLEIIKMAENKFELDNIPFEFKNAVHEVTRMLKARANKKGITFNVFLPQEALWVKGDPTRVKQILINLVSNAIKFTHEGHVDVMLELQKQTPEYTQVEIRVTDTGIGLTEEEIGKLFERFSQANAAVGEQYGGSGLGLVIAKNLAGLMSGDITIESTKGKGSIFHCVIRCHNLLEQERKNFILKTLTVVSAPPLHPIGKLSILIVDDNALNRKILNSILTKANHQCFLAVDGRDAVTQYTQRHFDIIFMDIMMPVLDGMDATREIRRYEQEKQLPHVPIIAITGNALDTQRREAIESGMDAYIAKPYKKEQILTITCAFCSALPSPLANAPELVTPSSQRRGYAQTWWHVPPSSGEPLIMISMEKVRRNNLYPYLDRISARLHELDIPFLLPTEALRAKASAMGWQLYSVRGKNEHWAVLDFEQKAHADKLLEAIEQSKAAISLVSFRGIKYSATYSVVIIFSQDSALISAIEKLLLKINKKPQLEHRV